MNVRARITRRPGLLRSGGPPQGAGAAADPGTDSPTVPAIGAKHHLLNTCRAVRSTLAPRLRQLARPRESAESEPSASRPGIAFWNPTAVAQHERAVHRFGVDATGRMLGVIAGGPLLALLLSAFAPVAPVHAQELEPRAYLPAPVGLNLLVAADSVSTGDLSFDPSVPITNGHANLNAAVAGYYRTLDFFGRSANAGIVVPYVRGDLNGLLLGQPVSAHRSAFGDPKFRLAVNLYGAPAMTPRQYAAFREETIVGASLNVVPPLGAYDSTKLINVGSNRWAFKPEIGATHAMGHWRLEADVGGWFFTDNTNFWNGKLRQQDPIGSLQLHVIYTFLPMLWLAVDGNYYTGGRTTIDGKENFDLQKNSRVGVTLALPAGRSQTIKIAYSVGARTTIGNNFQTVGISYQYAWMNRR
jgi:hypothetical protein